MLNLNTQARLDLIEKIASKVEGLVESDKGFEAVAIRTVLQQVDQFTRVTTASPEDSAKLAAEMAEALVKRFEMTRDLDKAVKLQHAAKALESAREIGRREEITFSQFTVEDLKAKAPPPEHLLSGLTAFAGLAGTLAGPDAHDSYFRYEVPYTVKDARSNDLGMYHVRSRVYMEPFEVILDATNSKALTVDGAISSQEQERLHTVLRLNQAGIRDGALGIVSAMRGEVISKSEGYAEAAVALPNHFQGSDRKFDLDRASVRYLKKLGAELRFLRERYENNPDSPIDWTQFPLAHDALAATHDRWVQRNIANASDKDRIPFDRQDTRDQIRNVPSLIGAIVGTLRAKDAVDDILRRGVLDDSGKGTPAGFALQLHLVSSAREALAANDFGERNRIHAEAVADEGALLAAHAAKITDRGVLSAMHQVFLKASLEAGEAFKPGGKGASVAPSIAVDHAAELLHAMHPQKSIEELKTYVKELLAQATVDDIAAIAAGSFQRKVDERGRDLIEAFKKSTSPDDYFYAQIDGLPVSANAKSGLSSTKLRDLEAILRLANATWKSGQVHRSSSSNVSRVNPAERAVYNPYELLLGPHGSAHEAVFAIVKDLFELQRVGTKP